MAKVLVTYYSHTGHTKAMAESVGIGVEAAGAEVRVTDIQHVTAQDLLRYDGIIIGSPTYYGLLVAAVKELLDESVQFHGQLSGKIGGAFASSANIGGGNETTLLSILQALLVHGMVIQGSATGDHYGPVAINVPDDRVKKQCEALGRRVAELAIRLFG